LDDFDLTKSPESATLGKFPTRELSEQSQLVQDAPPPLNIDEMKEQDEPDLPPDILEVKEAYREIFTFIDEEHQDAFLL
jgi:hypothetical protein